MVPDYRHGSEETAVSNGDSEGHKDLKRNPMEWPCSKGSLRKGADNRDCFLPLGPRIQPALTRDRVALSRLFLDLDWGCLQFEEKAVMVVMAPPPAHSSLTSLSSTAACMRSRDSHQFFSY